MYKYICVCIHTHINTHTHTHLLRRMTILIFAASTLTDVITDELYPNPTRQCSKLFECLMSYVFPRSLTKVAFGCSLCLYAWMQPCLCICMQSMYVCLDAVCVCMLGSGCVCISACSLCMYVWMKPMLVRGHLPMYTTMHVYLNVFIHTCFDG